MYRIQSLDKADKLIADMEELAAKYKDLMQRGYYKQWKANKDNNANKYK